MADHLLGALQTVLLPALAKGFPLETADDLRRAYREYAKANDERLIFDGHQLELSPKGREIAFENWTAFSCSPSEAIDDDCLEDIFDSGNLFACHQRQATENRYWQTLEKRIDAFVATPQGQEQARLLHDELWHFLMSTLFHNGELPNDLYERVVAAELCWRAQIRATHKLAYPELYQRGTPMKIEIIESFNPDKSINSTETVQIPASHTFEQFCMLLCHQSGIRVATDTDIWCYEDPTSNDLHSNAHFKPITKANYGNLKELLVEVPKQAGQNVVLTLWHETQIAYVRRDLIDILLSRLLELHVDEPSRRAIRRRFFAPETKKQHGPSTGKEELGVRRVHQGWVPQRSSPRS